MSERRPMLSWEDIRRRSRILVVDDEDAVLRNTDLILRNAGYRRIELVTDPRRVRSRVEELEPDLVLLDLTMPHMDGYEVLDEIRDLLPSTTYLPVIVLTGRVENAAMLRALVAGAKDFLTKPVDFVELMLRVRMHLETRYQFLECQRELEVLRATRR